jgi:L-aminopeptidase/D-esterase-like protein
LRQLPGNTTLTVVVTNQRLDRRALRQLGRQVHASMARAIHPFHALLDGDVLYAVTTAEVENEALDPVALSVVASELAWDAVLASFEPDEAD